MLKKITSSIIACILSIACLTSCSEQDDSEEFTKFNQTIDQSYWVSSLKDDSGELQCIYGLSLNRDHSSLIFVTMNVHDIIEGSYHFDKESLYLTDNSIDETYTFPYTVGEDDSLIVYLQFGEDQYQEVDFTSVSYSDYYTFCENLTDKGYLEQDYLDYLSNEDTTDETTS